MTALFYTSYMVLILGLAALALLLADHCRIVIRAAAIDWIEIASRYNQMLLDRDRQIARLNTWEEFATEQIINHRVQLQDGEK
ncbi:MAG: hypothetical protein GY796_36490 [Chloroflexi bacterium]|nr:hypothetical protein [Chloroflexota bacterium]